MREDCSDRLVIPARILAGDFAGWLRDAIAERRMSYRMVALRAGIDHTCVSRLATGNRLPSLATAVAIIRVFQRPSPDHLAATASDHHDAFDAASGGGAS